MTAIVRRLGSLVRDHRRGLLGAAVLLGVAAVVLMVTRPWSTTTYDLHATGVWVVSERDEAFGRVNPQLPELDHVEERQGAQVFQDGDDAYLLVQGTAGSTLRRLLPQDPAAETPEHRFDGLVYLQPGGGVVGAVSDGEVTRISGDENLSAEVLGEVSPEAGRAGHFVVGVDGTIAVLEPDGTVVVAGPDDDELRPVDIDAVGDDGPTSLTLVGDHPVVLDEGGSGPRLLQPGRTPIDLDDLVGDEVVDISLQRPGSEASTVVVGTEDRVATIDLSDSRVEVLAEDGAGTPVSPVVDDGCTYGAWRGSGAEGEGGAMVVLCEGEDPVRGDGLVVGGKAQLVTGSTTVLNDFETGEVHVAVDGRIASISDWPEETREREETVLEEVERDPSAKIAPVAVADTEGPGTDPETAGVGVRAGRVAFLPVLRNDWDQNGDILTVDDSPETFDLSDVPEDHRERFSVAQDGRSIVADMTGWAEGDPDAYTLRYHASDGDQISAEPAEVEIAVVAADAAGRAPQRQNPRLPFEVAVQTGERVTRDVLGAFWDYDGDPLYLANARVAGDADHSVSWQADGRLTFSASAQPGTYTVELEISDTTGESIDASLAVTVDTPDAVLRPVLNNDVVTAVKGVPVTFDPLANDIAPTGESLSLEGEPEVVRALDDDLDGLTIVTDPQGGGLTLTSAEPGRYVVHYRVVGDDVGATVLVRVLEDDPAPLVRPDVVVVEESTSAEVDLLANDLTVGGAMLSVTGLELEPDGLRLPDSADADGGVTPAIEDLLSAGVGSDLRTFRADALADALEGTVATYRYTASTADRPGRSTVTVVVTASQGNRPPVTRPVEGIRVRAGGAVTVRLDRFAHDPDLDPLEVDVPADGQPTLGDARPSGTSIRYFAPADATGEAVVAVEVADPFATRTATLSFDITPADAENRPPVALDVEARTRAGREVVVPVPLEARDPDGDDVRIQGRVGSQPLDGDVELNAVDQTFVFTPTAGDPQALREQVFEYTLIDEKGLASEPAEVKVLVTAAAERNTPPVATVDRVIARPDAVVFVDPVLNDTDLDRQPVRLAEVLDRSDGDGEPVGEPVVVDAGECDAEAVDGRVRIGTGAAGEVCRIAYGVTDADPEDDRPAAVVEGRILVTTIGGFPGVRPSARNDYPAREGRDATSVVLDVLANDEDLDGDPAELRVALVGDDGEEVDGRDSVRLDPDGTMSIDIDEARRMVRYRITDGDGLTADAVVRVPGTSENRPPELRPDQDPIVLAEDEESITVDLDDHIVDPDGDEVLYLGATSGTRFQVDTDGIEDGRVVLSRQTLNLGGVGTMVVATSDDRDPPALASLSLPVEVEGVNTAPEWSGDPCGPVSRGGDPTTVRLSADDIDPGDTERLVFGIDGARTKEGVTISLGGARGRMLTIDPGEAPAGQSVSFVLTVEDARSRPIEQRCTVEVTQSTAPPLVAADRTAVLAQGETETFSLGEMVSNAQGGLEIVTQNLNPAGLGRLTPRGDDLVFTAGADVSGPAVITYTVADGLDDPTDRRRASGRIAVTVRGRPDRPTAVRATLVDDGAAVALQWTPGDDNGAPATFLVSGGGVTKECSSAACTVTEADGLSLDGGAVRFTVVARNDVGSSEPSQPSNEVRPDRAPNPVTDLRAVNDGAGSGTSRQVTFHWDAPARQGSEVIGYRLEGTGGVPSGDADAGQRSLTVEVTADGGTLTVTPINAHGDGPSATATIEGSYGRPFLVGSFAPFEGAGDTVRFDGSFDPNGPAEGLGWTMTGTGCGGAAQGSSATISASLSGCPSGTRVSLEVRNNGFSVAAGTATVDLDVVPAIADDVEVTAGEGLVSIDFPTTTRGTVATWVVDGVPLPSGTTTVTRDAWTPTTLTVVGRNAAGEDSNAVTSDSVVPYAAPQPPVVTATLVPSGGLPLVEDVEVAFTWEKEGGTGNAHDYQYRATRSDRPFGYEASGAPDADGVTNVVLEGIAPTLGDIEVTVEIIDTTVSLSAIGTATATPADPEPGEAPGLTDPDEPPAAPTREPRTVAPEPTTPEPVPADPSPQDQPGLPPGADGSTSAGRRTSTTRSRPRRRHR